MDLDWDLLKDIWRNLLGVKVKMGMMRARFIW